MKRAGHRRAVAGASFSSGKDKKPAGLWRDRLRRWLPWLFFWLYLAVLLRITVFRNGCFSHGLCSGRCEWIPFVYLMKLLFVGNWRYFSYLFFGNLLWFAPLGFFLRQRGRKLAGTVLLGMGLSVLIEAAQFLLGSGVTEVEDVILNTCGAAAGFALSALTERIMRRLRSHSK